MLFPVYRFVNCVCLKLDNFCTKQSRFSFKLSKSEIKTCCVQVDSPFIVCISYAFHTPDKLCFLLDLMNGKLIKLSMLSYIRLNEVFIICDLIKAAVCILLARLA